MHIVEYLYKIKDQYSSQLAKMASAQKMFSNDLARGRQDFEKFKSGIKTFSTVAIVGGLAAAGAAMVKGIQLASDLTEAQNVIDVTYGESAGVMNDWAKGALDAFGLGELQAKKYSGTMGALIKSTGITGDRMVGMAQDLTGLAGDFASFYNLPHDVAFEKLKSGISGETEPLKALGINMSVANMEAFALTQGINKQWKAMSQAEQTALRYQFIMNASADAQGDFNRTLETSLANQLRVLKTRFAEKLGQSMMPILPKLTALLKKANEIISGIDAEAIGEQIAKAFDIAVKAINFIIPPLKFVFNVIKPFIPIIIGIVAAWKAYRMAMMVAAAAQIALNVAMTANPIGLIITAVGVAIGLIYLLYKNWEKVKASMMKVIDMPLFNMLFPVFGLLGEIWKRWEYIKLSFKAGGIKGAIMGIGKALLSFILKPFETMLSVVKNLPLVGKVATAGLEKIAAFREGMFGDEEELRKQAIMAEKEKAKAVAQIEKQSSIDFQANMKAKTSMVQKAADAVDSVKKDIGMVITAKAGDIASKIKTAAYELKYIAQPEGIREPKPMQTNFSADVGLQIYKEQGINVVPFGKSGNVGVNMQGAM